MGHPRAQALSIEIYNILKDITSVNFEKLFQHHRVCTKKWHKNMESSQLITGAIKRRGRK
jgi:hypothetical protein